MCSSIPNEIDVAVDCWNPRVFTDPGYVMYIICLSIVIVYWLDRPNVALLKNVPKGLQLNCKDVT